MTLIKQARYVLIQQPELTSMDPELNPSLAYTLIYVRDVTKSIAFYANAFGYNIKRLDESNRWGELESGPTTIAFAPVHQKETDERTGTVMERERAPVDVCFAYADVDATYRRAVNNGAIPVSMPMVKSWGQKVGYVRDIDGIVVRLESYMGKTI